MSGRNQVQLMEILARYVEGYFPLYDVEGEFYWERLDVRAVIPVNAATVARARRLGKRSIARFEIRYSTALDEMLVHLQDERVKANSWVKPEIVAIYRALARAGL